MIEPTSDTHEFIKNVKEWTSIIIRIQNHNLNVPMNKTYLKISLQINGIVPLDLDRWVSTTQTWTDEYAWLTYPSHMALVGVQVEIMLDTHKCHFRKVLGVSSVRSRSPQLVGGIALTFDVYTGPRVTHSDKERIRETHGLMVIEKMIRPGNDRAVMWIPGRNDTFTHPHVADVMLAKGYDVFICHHRGSLGASMVRGYLPSPTLASHVVDGDFTALHEDIEILLAQMTTYKKRVVYAHSTGALILSSYLLTQGSKHVFDGIYLNSPFFAWGNVGGKFYEKILDWAPWLLDVLHLPSKLQLRGGESCNPSGVRESAILYKCDPVDRRWFETSPLTLGFAVAVTRAMRKLRARTGPLVPSTTMVSMITANADSVLYPRETMDQTRRIFGVDGTTLKHGRHDVFMSPLRHDLDEALDHLSTFLQNQNI